MASPYAGLPFTRSRGKFCSIFPRNTVRNKAVHFAQECDCFSAVFFSTTTAGKGAKRRTVLHFRKAIDQIFPKTPPLLLFGADILATLLFRKTRTPKNDRTAPLYVRTQRCFRVVKRTGTECACIFLVQFVQVTYRVLLFGVSFFFFCVVLFVQRSCRQTIFLKTNRSNTSVSRSSTRRTRSGTGMWRPLPLE